MARMCKAVCRIRLEEVKHQLGFIKVKKVMRTIVYDRSIRCHSKPNFAVPILQMSSPLRIEYWPPETG